MDAASAVREREGAKYGGSAEGIEEHYDIGNAFWPPVLGATMAYSCALFESPDEELEIAQRRKLEWHLERSLSRSARRILDVGCGWGSMLRPLSALRGVERITGLTLSRAQVEYLKELDLPRTEVRLENWAEHTPADLYDSIISIGAFEHFAKREERPDEKISVYRDFFGRCHRWLSPAGAMSLQTIAYGNMRREEASDFMAEIFPDSDLPFLSDIVAAVDGLFEVVLLRNDRLHYALTVDRWASNLRQNFGVASDLIGRERAQKMSRYFKLVSFGFRTGKQQLLRLALRPIHRNWKTSSTAHWGLPS